MVAKSVENVNITKDIALTEKVEMVSGRADSVNMRDKSCTAGARRPTPDSRISRLKTQRDFVMRTELHQLENEWIALVLQRRGSPPVCGHFT
jgi:hypothetical protein